MKFEWDERKNQTNMNADATSNTSKTDWARIDAMSDEDIDTSDIPPLSDAFFANAQLRLPTSAISVSIQVDPETFAWFQAQGESAKHQMAIALRIYAEAHKAHIISTNQTIASRQSSTPDTAD